MDELEGPRFEPSDSVVSHQRITLRRAWTTIGTFALRLLAVPLGLAGLLLLGWALVRAILSLGFHSRVGQVLLALVALCIVVEALEAGWHQLSALQRRKAQASWRWRTRGLLRSKALSPWPVVLVLLTSLLGIADWFPAPGWSRPKMLGLIATVGIYGYQREKREKQKDLLAFADVAGYRFAEEAKRIHQERDREHEEEIRADRDRNRAIEERNRDIEKAKQSARIDRINRHRRSSE